MVSAPLISQIGSFPKGRDKDKKYLKPPTKYACFMSVSIRPVSFPNELQFLLLLLFFAGPHGDDNDLPFKVSILNSSGSRIKRLHKGKHASKNKDSGPSRTRGNDNRILSCVTQAIMLEIRLGRAKQVTTCHPSTKHVELL